MQTELDRVRARFASLSDEEIRTAVGPEARVYREDAIEIAREEATRRGIVWSATAAEPAARPSVPSPRHQLGVRWFKKTESVILVVVAVKLVFAWFFQEPASVFDWWPGERIARILLLLVAWTALFGGPAYLLGWLWGRRTPVPDSGHFELQENRPPGEN